MSNKELLSSLPKIDELLKEEFVLEKLQNRGRNIVVEALRETVDFFRKEILAERLTSFTKEQIFEEFSRKLFVKEAPALKKIINATGVVLHTNLGRAILSEQAVKNVINVSEGYSNLEYNLEEGKRGSRYSHVEELIKKITGAEAAMVVNNNAAAVMLVLNTLCHDREAIVSRGQLVEIGGSFRIPEVMKFSGAKLVEVGTTNRTHLKDYEESITENTGVLLKVHTSNYKIIGFTEEVSLEMLSALGKERNIPVVEDIGSGVLIDFSKYGFAYESTVQESIKKGADIVTFSGDKMLGGPQAGIIVGKKEYLDKIKKNQLTRALRIDKLTLAALEGTLRYYIEEEQAVKNIPTLNMILTSQEIHKRRAQRLKNKLLRSDSQLEIKVERDYSMVGGGSMPEEKIPTYVLKVRSSKITPEELEKGLRENSVPIIVRIYNGYVYMDLRTIFDKDFEILIEAFENIMQRR